MNKTGFGTIFGVTIPLACAIIFGMMCYTQKKDRDLAKADEVQQLQNVQALRHMLATVTIEPLMSKKPAFEATPDEQAQFLTQLRTDAQGAGVKLVQYMNMGQVLPARSNDPKNAQPQSDFRPVASTLTVQGPYQGVRAFAFSLLRADRLMNMNGVSWKRDADGRTTTLSFTLIRYVTVPTTRVTTKTVAMVDSGSAGGAIR